MSDIVQTAKAAAKHKADTGWPICGIPTDRDPRTDTIYNAGAAAGAVLIATRLPTRDELIAAIRSELIKSTGTCICDDAYTIRGLEDPYCAWHIVNGEELPQDTADAVLALISNKIGDNHE